MYIFDEEFDRWLGLDDYIKKTHIRSALGNMRRAQNDLKIAGNPNGWYTLKEATGAVHEEFLSLPETSFTLDKRK